jgi:hypothetical protein
MIDRVLMTFKSVIVRAALLRATGGECLGLQLRREPTAIAREIDAL